jgi:hypothetical protein
VAVSNIIDTLMMTTEAGYETLEVNCTFRGLTGKKDFMACSHSEVFK